MLPGAPSISVLAEAPRQWMPTMPAGRGEVEDWVKYPRQPYWILDKGRGTLERGFGTGHQCSRVLPPPQITGAVTGASRPPEKLIPHPQSLWDTTHSWLRNLKVKGSGWQLPTEQPSKESLLPRARRNPMKKGGWRDGNTVRENWLGITLEPTRKDLLKTQRDLSQKNLNVYHRTPGSSPLVSRANERRGPEGSAGSTVQEELASFLSHSTWPIGYTGSLHPAIAVLLDCSLNNQQMHVLPTQNSLHVLV